MVRTRLEDQTIGVHFNSKDDASIITDAINQVLDTHGEAIVTNTTLATDINTDDTPDYIEYDCKLEIDFTITNENTIILGNRIIEDLENKLHLNDINIYYNG